MDEQRILHKPKFVNERSVQHGLYFYKVCAFAEVDRGYTVTRSYYNRRVAAYQRLRTVRAEYEANEVPRSLEERAGELRNRAQQLRAMAASVTTPGAKEVLLETADELERQALEIDRLARPSVPASEA